MGQQQTILFADICGSSGITQTLGASAGTRVMDRVRDELGRATARHGGRVVKSVGDEIMSMFLTPADGIRAAIEMQRVVPLIQVDERVRPEVRIGVHVGPVLRNDGDVYGDTVNQALRLTAFAVGGQILTTAEVQDMLQDINVPFRPLGEHHLKGNQAGLTICEVLSEDDTGAPTLMAPRMDSERPERIEFFYAERVVILRSDSTALRSFGRGAKNTLVVVDSEVSRTHARVTVQNGRFHLADLSSNGTYIREDGGSELFVHMEEVLLRGSGVLRLGRAFGDEDAPEIGYRIV